MERKEQQNVYSTCHCLAPYIYPNVLAMLSFYTHFAIQVLFLTSDKLIDWLKSTQPVSVSA